jgi:hypothetical protein
LSSWKGTKYCIFWVCVCSFSYLACKAHAPCLIVICGMADSTVFFLVILEIHEFRKKTLLNIKCFNLICKFVSNITDSKKNSARCYHKCTLVCMYSTVHYSACTVLYVGLHVQYCMLVCMYSTVRWSACTVLYMQTDVQYCTVLFIIVRF